jgi:uridine kinase
MRLCFLISGLLRDFTETLFPYLCSLQSYHEIDIYIATGKGVNDSKYLNQSFTHIGSIIGNPMVKLFLIEDTDRFQDLQISQRERNTFLQWYRLQNLSKYLPSKPYDIYIRLRPDIHFNISASALSKIISDLDSKNTFVIPQGNDIFDPKFLNSSDLKPLNDQIAFFSHNYLSIYTSLFSTLQSKEAPIISEYALADQLSKYSVVPQRILLPYTLSLSSCRVLAIAGDSGSGKSTIVRAIESVFPFDSSVLLETDRYHKWERSDEHWNSMTHLHPDANYLEKMVDDTYKLKLGHDIYAVDYDHMTGKFTDAKQIQSKDIVLLCGLHTLYQDSLRQHISIKMYIDTQEELKTFWKLQRDILERAYSSEQILEKIKRRQPDYRSYILPQKDHANIILHYSTSNINLLDVCKKIPEHQIDFSIEIKEILISFSFQCLTEFSSRFEKLSNGNYLFHIKTHIDHQSINIYLDKEKIMCERKNILNGYLGVVQALILRLLLHS